MVYNGLMTLLKMLKETIFIYKYCGEDRTHGLFGFIVSKVLGVIGDKMLAFWWVWYINLYFLVISSRKNDYVRFTT